MLLTLSKFWMLHNPSKVVQLFSPCCLCSQQCNPWPGFKISHQDMWPAVYTWSENLQLAYTQAWTCKSNQLAICMAQRMYTIASESSFFYWQNVAKSSKLKLENEVCFRVSVARNEKNSKNLPVSRFGFPVNIEGWLKIWALHFVYCHIWRNSPNDDCHFLYIFLNNSFFW